MNIELVFFKRKWTKQMYSDCKGKNVFVTVHTEVVEKTKLRASEFSKKKIKSAATLKPISSVFFYENNIFLKV